MKQLSAECAALRQRKISFRVSQIFFSGKSLAVLHRVCCSGNDRKRDSPHSLRPLMVTFRDPQAHAE